MKKILIIIFISILLFPSCSTVDPIVEDVCEITEEICYYANLVCENWHPSTENKELDLQQKSELLALKNELQFINANLKTNQPNNEKFSNEDLKIKLITIREDLKRIYEQQSTLRN